MGCRYSIDLTSYGVVLRIKIYKINILHHILELGTRRYNRPRRSSQQATLEGDDHMVIDSLLRHATSYLFAQSVPADNAMYNADVWVQIIHNV